MIEDNPNPNPEGVIEDSGDTTQSYVERRAAELRKQLKPDEPDDIEEEDKVEASEGEQEKPKGDAAPEGDEDSEDSEDSEKAEGEDEIVLSQIDYKELTRDQAKELGQYLAEKLGENIGAFSEGTGSGAGKDNAKLRSENRELKEKLKQVTEGLEKVSPNANAFSHISDEADLKQEEAKIVQLYDHYNNRAIRGDWDINDSGEEGITDNGNFFPKEKMAEILNQWQLDLRAIPERRIQLQKRGSVKKEREKSAKVLAEKLDWFGDSESEQSQAYSEKMKNSSVASAIQLFPDLEPILMEAFAYEVEGRTSKKRKKLNVPLKSKASSMGTGDNGAIPSKQDKSRGLQEAEQRVKSGQFSRSDWVTISAPKYKKFFNAT